MTISPTSPKVWGKSFWNTFHIVALGYSEDPTSQEMQSYKTFYETFGQVLPCKKCAKNYIDHLRELPLSNRLINKDALFAWTVSMHNLVNREMSKPEWTVDYAKNFFLNGSYNACVTEMEANQVKNDIWRLILIFMIIVNILVIVYCMYIRGG